MPNLNLTDYDEQQVFEAIPPGKYFAVIFDAEDRETQNDGKVPAGTPMIWVHCQITGKVGEAEQGEDSSPYYNRRAFRNLTVPPEGHDAKKAKAMNGMIVALYRAVGYTDEQILSGSFEVDSEDLIEKPLVIQLNRKLNNYSKEIENNIVGFFSLAAVEGAEEAATAGSLL